MNQEAQHPELLRPGGPSPSQSPDPSQQQQGMSRKSLPYSQPAQSNGGSQPPQYPPQQYSSQQYSSQQAPVANYSSRFPSANYPQDGNPPNVNTNVYPPPPNPFTDAHSRSRSSTQSSPQRANAAPNAALAPSAYPGRPSSSSVSSGTAKQPPPTSPTLHHQSLYSRPPSSSASASASTSNPRLAKSAIASPEMMPAQPYRAAQGPGQGPPSTHSHSHSQSQAQSQFSTPITALAPARPTQILLINPNSTRAITDACLASIRPKLPPNVELTGYTAPHPAPSAIESTTDAILSSEACIRDLHLHSAANNETVRNFDGFLVACFSAHPLIAALRELYDVPVIGIMEASLYVARMLGGRFGIVATSRRSKFLQDDAVAAYGLSHFSVGSEATALGVLELDTRPKEEVAKRVGHCARRLVDKGADVIILGCAGMRDAEVRAAKDAVRDEDGRRLVNVIEGVEAGVWVLSSLAGMGCPTSKKGMFSGSHENRRARGQEWL